MKIIYKKEGIRFALGIFVFAVSMILLNSDGLYVNKVLAQEANSTAVQGPADKLFEYFSEPKSKNRQTSLSLPVEFKFEFKLTYETAYCTVI
jgi:hypothetical protein